MSRPFSRKVVELHTKTIGSNAPFRTVLLINMELAEPPIRADAAGGTLTDRSLHE
jgi:hypothetical protein